MRKGQHYQGGDSEQELKEDEAQQEQVKQLILQSIMDKIVKLQSDNENYCIQKNKDSKLQIQGVDNEINEFKMHCIDLKPILEQIRQKIDAQKKLEPIKKDLYKQTIQKLSQELLLIEKHGLNIKMNKYITELYQITRNELQDMYQNLDQLLRKCCACCCGGSIKKMMEVINTNLQMIIKYFWQLINKLESQKQIDIVRPFDLDEIYLRKTIKEIIDKYFPKGKIIYKEIQVPVDKIIEKEVEKVIYVNEAKPDQIREAHEHYYGIGRPNNPAEGLKLYDYEDRQNNSAAWNFLGQIYLEGKYVQQDLKRSHDYYLKSSQLKDPDGIYHIGMFVEKNLIQNKQLQNRQQQIDFAINQYKQVADKHLDAKTDLGYIYEHGIEENGIVYFSATEQSRQEAKKLYESAHAKNFPKGSNMLGTFLLNHNQGLQCFEQAKNYHYVRAYVNLGICYEFGYGVEKNIPIAKQLFKEAAEKGDTQGKLKHVYYLLEDATGTDNLDQYIEAFSYLEQILKEDPLSSEGYFYMGFLYELGLAVQLNELIAFKYYEKSASFKNPKALKKLGDIYFSGFGKIKQSISKALHYYEQSAECNYPQAIICLGSLFEQGTQEIPIDYKKAFEYYEKAVKLNHREGYTCLGLMYQLGKYVEQNEEQANYLFSQAAEQGDDNAKDILDAKVENDMDILQTHIRLQIQDKDTLVLEEAALQLLEKEKVNMILKAYKEPNQKNQYQ